jgi:hypothetical protein
MGFSKSHGERGFQNPTARATFKIPRRRHNFQNPTACAIFKSPRRMRVRTAKRPSERFGTQDDKSYRAAQENA